ncbi:MAG: GAF domain-containing protein [Flavobacteriales bacterium]|nr:GAF domain-containing protein [Flavobacteriales bacterium]
MSTKAVTYQTVINQVHSLIKDENDIIANVANIAALLHTSFGFWWTGFYFVKNNELVLGPFQGPVACTRIGYGKGVCGTAWKEKKTIVVPDVHQFPGHIACSAASNSEIVVPVMVDGQVMMVLDIDSTEYGCFDDTDKQYLEEIAVLIAQKIPAFA